MHPYGNWEGHWFGGGFMMVLFYIILVFLMVYLFRHMIGKGSKKETALDILNKRYASGEITKEQLDEMKKNILS
ncbi:MAG TPA: SHOCT domain-containing protein [Psychromonas sp.]